MKSGALSFLGEGFLQVEGLKQGRSCGMMEVLFGETGERPVRARRRKV